MQDLEIANAAAERGISRLARKDEIADSIAEGGGAQQVQWAGVTGDGRRTSSNSIPNVYTSAHVMDLFSIIMVQEITYI